MDDRLRRAERDYVESPTIESLRRYNSALTMAGQEAFLPIEHLQMLFEDITNLLDDVKIDDSGPDDDYLEGIGLIDQGIDSFRVVQGRYGHPYGSQISPATLEPIFTWTHFRITAYNVFGDENRSAHITIKKEGIYRNQTESHELDIFTDDVIYGSWYCDPRRSMRSSNRDRHPLNQFTLPLHQPWVYSAKELLDFTLKHWNEVARQNPDEDIEQLRRLAITGGIAEKNAYARAISRITDDPQTIVDALDGPAAYDFFSEGLGVGSMAYYVERVNGVFLDSEPYPLYNNRQTSIPTQFTIEEFRYEAVREYGEVAIRAIWDLSIALSSRDPFSVSIDNLQLQVRTVPRTNKCNVWFLHEEGARRQGRQSEGNWPVSDRRIAFSLQHAWYDFMASYIHDN